MLHNSISGEVPPGRRKGGGRSRGQVATLGRRVIEVPKLSQNLHGTGISPCAGDKRLIQGRSGTPPNRRKEH